MVMKDYADEGFLKLLKKVREALDPEGIMAPKRWSTEERK